MHKDTREALDRLEQQLLTDEDLELTDEELDLLTEGILFDDEEFEDEEEVLTGDYRAYNADSADLDLDDYSRQVYEEPRQSKGELWFSVVILGLISLVMVGWAVSLL